MDIPVKVGDILYLHEWKSETEMNVVPREIICLSDCDIYFKSSYNYHRSKNQLGRTIFVTEKEAQLKRKEWYKENYLSC